MRRIYLSGAMSGVPDHNFPAFMARAAELRAAGWDVVNPAELNPDTSMTWEECLRIDLRELCAYVGHESDGPVWVDAQGAIVPRVVAWAEMPLLQRPAKVAGRIGRDPDLVPLANGRSVDFGGAWKVPA